MTSLLLAALLAAPAAAVHTAEPVESRIVTWESRKLLCGIYNRQIVEHHRRNRLLSREDLVRLEEHMTGAWGVALEVQTKQTAALQARLGHIDAAAADGRMDAATAEDLKARTRRVFQAVMYYLYGNMWLRVLEEFDTLPAHPRAILGARLDVVITDAELKAFSDANHYDHRRWGLPDLPETRVSYP